MTTTELIELLCQRFPSCFAQFERRRRPLKVGIIDDLLGALGAQVERKQLSAALRLYVGNLHYRAAQTAGAMRIDLNGNPAGTVSEADAASAAADVADRKAKAAARRQEAMRIVPSTVMTVDDPEVHIPPVEPAIAPPKRLSLADLRAAAARRKAQ